MDKCNISDAVEDILNEIECNIYVEGDDTWGDSAVCDREYLSEYITNRIKELIGEGCIRDSLSSRID